MEKGKDGYQELLSRTVAIRVDDEVINMMDECREAQSKGGMQLSRSAFLKSALLFYLSYRGYQVNMGEAGGRRKIKGAK